MATASPAAEQINASAGLGYLLTTAQLYQQVDVIMICIAMGWPDETFPANAVVSTRKSVDEAVRFVGFGE